MDGLQHDVLSFWFGAGAEDATVLAQKAGLWFQGGEGVDAEIHQRFGGLHRQAVAGELDHWAATPKGWLALIIVLDQFSRNLHRGKPDAFAQDGKALKLAEVGINAGWDSALRPIERLFAYLPMEHSEDLATQERSVAAFKALAAAVSPTLRQSFTAFVSYAERHRDVIAQWGRFPHRNPILGRPSSPEEIAFLQQPGSSF